MIGAIFSVYSDKSASMWFSYPATFAFLLSLIDILFIYKYYEESLPKVDQFVDFVRFCSAVDWN